MFLLVELMQSAFEADHDAVLVKHHLVRHDLDRILLSNGNVALLSHYLLVLTHRSKAHCKHVADAGREEQKGNLVLAAEID